MALKRKYKTIRNNTKRKTFKKRRIFKKRKTFKNRRTFRNRKGGLWGFRTQKSFEEYNQLFQQYKIAREQQQNSNSDKMLNELMSYSIKPCSKSEDYITCEKNKTKLYLEITQFLGMNVKNRSQIEEKALEYYRNKMKEKALRTDKAIDKQRTIDFEDDMKSLQKELNPPPRTTYEESLYDAQ